MVWTRGDNLIHGLTQLGLLIDSLFLFLFLLFRREEVDIIYISSVSRIIGEHREREREREKRDYNTYTLKETYQLFVKSAQSNHRVVIHHDKRFDHLPNSSLFLSFLLLNVNLYVWSTRVVLNSIFDDAQTFFFFFYQKKNIKLSSKRPPPVLKRTSLTSSRIYMCI